MEGMGRCAYSPRVRRYARRGSRMLDGVGNLLSTRRPELKKTSNSSPPLLPSTPNSVTRTRASWRTSTAAQHATARSRAAAHTGGPRPRVRVSVEKRGREKQQGLPAAATATYRRRMAVPRGGWAKAVQGSGEGGCLQVEDDDHFTGNP